MRSYAAVFVSILLAELGDKTQLATLIFATNPGVSRIGVFLAAAAALVISSGRRSWWAVNSASGCPLGT